MAKDIIYTTDIIVGASGGLFVYFGGHMLWNSGSFMSPNNFCFGLAMTIFGAMLVGVAINKISIEYKNSLSVSSKKGKKRSNAKK